MVGIGGRDGSIFLVELEGDDPRVLINFGPKGSGVVEKKGVEFGANNVPGRVFVSQSDEVCVYTVSILKRGWNLR